MSHFIIWTFVNSGFHSFRNECKEGQKNRKKKNKAWALNSECIQILAQMHEFRQISYLFWTSILYEVPITCQRTMSMYCFNLEFSCVTSFSFIHPHLMEWKHHLPYGSNQNYRIILDARFVPQHMKPSLKKITSSVHSVFSISTWEFCPNHHLLT